MLGWAATNCSIWYIACGEIGPRLPTPILTWSASATPATAAMASATISAAVVLSIREDPTLLKNASKRDDGKASQNARDGSTCSVSGLGLILSHHAFNSLG